MKVFKMVAVVFVAVMFAGGSAFAAEKTLNILAPWQAHGQVFKVAPDRVKVVGSFDGIMYINSGGELDAAGLMCPGQEYINTRTGATEISADCIITKGEDKIAYAKLEARGKIGAANGKMTITGGEGKWKGMSGQGDIIIRTALGNLAVNKRTGAVIDRAAGLAVWPSMKVKLP